MTKDVVNAVVAWAGEEEDAAVVEVSATGAAAEASSRLVPDLVAQHVASRLSGQDPTLWGPAAEDEASIRLGWTELHNSSRGLLEPLAQLREELLAEGLTRVVLCGMGGSSLAPEVIVGTAGAQLVVLDSTDADQVARALADDLAATIVVVSSKSGTTVETDSQRRAFIEAFTAAGIDAASRLVVVTDPGSPLQQLAEESGYRAVFTADPNVGGRFSALSAFGLVPSALAGVDVARLLDEAAAVAPFFAEDVDANPALVLAAALAGTDPLRDKVLLIDAGSGLYHFGDWAEQLVAESTGKDDTGLLPVVASPRAPELDGPAGDVLPVLLCPIATEEPVVDTSAATDGAQHTGGSHEEAIVAPTEVTVAGSLGAMLLLWEHAIALAGMLLGINPFDQPDVESAKQAARHMLDEAPAPEPPAFTDSGVEVRGTSSLLDGTDSVEGVLSRLVAQLDEERGYLAVMAYLDREGRPAELLREVREGLAQRTGRPVTFGWGPRFLHSTGQYHKGGPRRGVFLQITASSQATIAVPERDFDFATLIAAQATGDAQVLNELGRPVLRLHVTSNDALAWLAGLLGGGGA